MTLIETLANFDKKLEEARNMLAYYQKQNRALHEIAQASFDAIDLVSMYHDSLHDDDSGKPRVLETYGKLVQAKLNYQNT